MFGEQNLTSRFPVFSMEQGVSILSHIRDDEFPDIVVIYRTIRDATKDLRRALQVRARRQLIKMLTAAEYSTDHRSMVSEWFLTKKLDAIAKREVRLDLLIRRARVWAMFGPDYEWLRNFAVNQPKDFYIDDRVDQSDMWRRDSEIESAVAGLAAWAKANGFDPGRLPVFPHFHPCGM